MRLLTGDLTGRLPCTWDVMFSVPRCPNPAVWWAENEGQPYLFCAKHYRAISEANAGLFDWAERQQPPPGAKGGTS